MAVRSQQVSVGTTATRLGFSPSFGGDARCSVLVRNRSAGAVFVGGSGVTTSNGVQLDAGETLTVELGSDESLFGVVSAGTAACHVLQASGN